MKRIHLTAALLTCTFLATPAAFADMMTYNGSDLTSPVTFHGAGLIADGATLPGSYEPTTDLTVLHSDENQDLLIAAASVPEPVSPGLLVVGAPLAALRLRRRR